MIKKTNEFANFLCVRYCFFLLMIIVGLIFFTSGFVTASESPDITSSASWEVRGSATFGWQGAVVGDNIGYDSKDQDNDGNYQNQGKAGSGIDYDFIISKTFFESPVTLEWHGCLPVTRYGYNMFGLGKLYNGGIFRQAVFQTRWEKQTAIQALVSSGGSSYLAGVSPSNGQFCATYKLVWDKDGIVTFYYNNQEVFKGTKKIKGPLVFYVRTFEKPATITELKVTGETDTAPVIESCSAKPSSGKVPFNTTVTCTASGSEKLTWSWDWNGDGVADETTDVDHADHIYDKPGTYNVGVVVTDASGGKAEKHCRVVALESSASNPHGAVGGTFSCTVKMKDGTTKQLNGKIHGSWDADMDSSGNIVATVKGMFGADGISGSFETSYDSSTGKLTGNWGNSSDVILSNPLTFVIEKGPGIHFKAPISGIAPTSDGGVPFEGEITVDLLGLTDASLGGEVSGTFNTDIQYQIKGTYSVLGVDMPVNLSETSSTSGSVSGTWEVSSASSTFTGKASGKFSGSINATLSTPAGPYPIKMPYSGSWKTVLGSSGNSIAFEGSWVEPNIQAMGSTAGSFGGGFGIVFGKSSGAWPIPVTFTSPESGGTYVDPTTGLTVTWKLVNFTGSGTLSRK